MKECLFTQLKGDCNNPSLEVLGLIKFICAGNAGYIGINAPTDTVMLTAINGNFAGNASRYAPAAGDYAVTANSGVTIIQIEADEKYPITRATSVFPANGFADFKFLNLTEIGCPNYRFNAELKAAVAAYNFDDLAVIENKSLLKKIDYNFGDKLAYGTLTTFVLFSNLEVLSISKCNLVGNLNTLANSTKIKTLTLTNTDVVGKIDDLGKLTLLTSVSVDATHCYGSVENFVKAQSQNGRTTESTGVQIKGELITFNGTAFGNGQFHTATWSPNSGDNTKIDVTVDGVTITIDA